MYPSRLAYHAPETIEEALALLARYGDEGKILAGGQSLIPLLKLRFAAPQAVIDINRIRGLDTLAASDGALRIGALVRHKACEKASMLGGRWGTLGSAAPQISDPIVRNWGTVCGSLAHADPQGDWGAALMAMDARVIVRSAAGHRVIPIDAFFHGPFTTALQADEIITEVQVPDPGEQSTGSYSKLERRVGDFATVGVAVHVSMSNGTVRRAGIALTSVGPTNIRVREAEQLLAGRSLDAAAIREAAGLAAEAARPHDDVRGSAAYKRNVVRVFTERGLQQAAEEMRS
jgi:carbon-monoxide dehydrogenase medium subunit